MIKTSQELKEQAGKIGLTFWKVHECSMCGYQCGYIFNGDNVSYDAGCGCIYQPPHPRSWEDLAETFNMNQPERNPDFKAKNPESYEKHYKVWQLTP